MVSIDPQLDWPDPMPVTDAERRAIFPPPRVDILEDARASYILPQKISKIHGPWSDEYTPYVRRPVKLLQEPPVRVWISASKQTGKSTVTGLLENYIIRKDPGPTGIVLPQEGIAKNRIRSKLRSLFEASPELLAKVRGDVRNLNIGEPTDLIDMMLYLCWSSSIATLSDNSIRDMIYDEVVLFDLLPNGESPIKAGRERQTTYQDIARELGVSSPGNKGDLHDVEMRAGSDEVWYVPCMKKGCGRWHELQTYVDEADEKYIVVDRPAPGKFYHHSAYETDSRLSRYVCPHCGKAWTEADRWRSNREGVYISHHREKDIDGNESPPQQSMDENGRITGPAPEGPQYSFTWHMMMAYPDFAPVAKMAMQFVLAVNRKQRGDLSEMKTWRRNYQAKGWKEVVRSINTDRLEEKITDRPMGKVPTWCKLLTVGADYHEDTLGNVRVEWLVDGWGDDMRNAVVACGKSASLDAMFRDTCGASWEWEGPCDRRELMVKCGFVDARYQPNDPHEGIIDVVYDFCLRYRKRKIWMPCMGATKPMPEYKRLDYKDLEDILSSPNVKYYRRKNARRYRGMKLVFVDTYKFKTLVMDMATETLGASKSTEFPAELPPEFWREFTNEHLVADEKGKWSWQPKDENKAADSHKFDIKVYSTAAGWHAGINRMWSEEAMAGPEEGMAGMNRPQRRVGHINRR